MGFYRDFWFVFSLGWLYWKRWHQLFGVLRLILIHSQASLDAETQKLLQQLMVYRHFGVILQKMVRQTGWVVCIGF